MGSSQKVDVRGDGRVVIYLRDGLKRPIWQARIRVPNSTGYKVVSTKTENQRDAERFALDLYEEIYMHVRAGGSIKSKTYRQVFDEWVDAISTLGSTRQGGSWIDTVDRVRAYSLDFFGNKKIDTISTSDFSDYWVWRKTNYLRRPPSAGTLRRERTSILPLFKFAVDKGYISQIPENEPPKAKLERRPTFTLDEWRQITRKAREWVREGQKKATGRDRLIAQQYFLILANTGMRVGEARGMRWSDLRTVKTEDGSRLVAEIKGKTGVREVVFQSGADEYIKRIYDLRCAEMGDSPETESLVFCHPDGSEIKTMKRSFKSLLDFASVPINRNGKPRTIYSLRHFYATQRLSNDASPFLLAKQMGTSVEMLEKFYGQTVNSAVAAQITKGNQRGEQGTIKRYPFD